MKINEYLTLHNYQNYKKMESTYYRTYLLCTIVFRTHRRQNRVADLFCIVILEKEIAA